MNIRTRILRVQVLLAVTATAVFAVRATPAGALPIAAATVAVQTWEPQPEPVACAVAHVHLLLQDVSGSMVERGLLRPALQQQATYVRKAPACTYLIYSSFGTTARVVVDGFLTTMEERQRIAEEIRTDTVYQRDTNFDEAAKLVELTLMKVERAYAGTPWSFTVSVISDYEPDPSVGHEPFDLRRYLEARRLDAGVAVFSVDLVPEGTLVPADEPGRHLTNGARVSVSVQGLSDLLSSLASSTQADVNADSTAVDTGTDVLAPTDRGPQAWWPQLGVLVVLLLVLALLVLLWARRLGPSLPESDFSSNSLTEDRAPRALRVSEHVVDPSGAVLEVVREADEIPVAAGVPVVFSTDPDAHIRVGRMEAIAAGEILRAVPQRNGRLSLSGRKGLRVNGQELPPGGVERDALDPLRVELGDRRWTITPVWSDVGRLDQLLTVPAAAR